MIEATSELYGECANITEEDIFQEFPILWDRKYRLTVSGIHHDTSNEIKRTARYCDTTHSRVEKGDRVKHIMIISAAGMIRWARVALCPNELEEFPVAIVALFHKVCEIEPLLSSFLIFDCQYRNGICTRDEPCGEHSNILKRLISMIPEKLYRDARNEAIIQQVKEGAGLIH